MALGDHDFVFPKGGRRFGQTRGLGRSRQDSLLGENSSVSTEMAHEVRGDSAEVKGQEIPVIVGIGSPLGEAFVTGRAGRVVATGVGVGLYSQFPVTVFIQGVLPLWTRRDSIRGPTTWPPLPSPHLITIIYETRPHGPRGRVNNWRTRRGLWVCGLGKVRGTQMKLLVSHWRRDATAGTEGQLRPELDGRADGRQVHVRGHGWVTGGCAQDGSTKTQSEQTQMTDTAMDGQSQADERGCAHGEERGWVAGESAVELGGQVGRQTSFRGDWDAHLRPSMCRCSCGPGGSSAGTPSPAGLGPAAASGWGQ